MHIFNTHVMTCERLVMLLCRLINIMEILSQELTYPNWVPMAEIVYILQLKTDEALPLKSPLVLFTARIFSASLIYRYILYHNPPPAVILPLQYLKNKNACPRHGPRILLSTHTQMCTLSTRPRYTITNGSRPLSPLSSTMKYMHH